MAPGGYAWWYVDALSDDGRYGLAIIAFIGSVFSPYYAWAGRQDPLDHCAVNVALYGPRGSCWSMTERGRGALWRDHRRLAIGPSALSWTGAALRIDIEEITAPVPRKLRGTVRIEPTGLNAECFDLGANGRHVWRPIAPSARVSVEMASPELRWRGEGYFDMNAGLEPLEDGFRGWSWSRARLRDGTAILYDAQPRDGDPVSLALRDGGQATFERVEPPPLARLPSTRWRLARTTRSDGSLARVDRELEDAPFYARSVVAARLFGEPVLSMHESLALDRFANPWVRLMLPFRMPRRA